jgi:hypothetical protein
MERIIQKRAQQPRAKLSQTPTIGKLVKTWPRARKNPWAGGYFAWYVGSQKI